jgi:hypothetical protein
MVDDELLAGIAEDVYLKVIRRSMNRDEADIPEYIAYRMINAIEWASPSWEYTKQIAQFLIDGGYVLPTGTSAIIRKYFNLGW